MVDRISYGRGYREPNCKTCRKYPMCMAWLAARNMKAVYMGLCELYEQEDIPQEYFEAGGK